MAMVSVVNWQPTGGFMVQVDRLGPKVGGHLAPCCTHCVNHGELSQCFKHDDSTINIVEVLLLLLRYKCIKYKIAVITQKALSTSVPPYIDELLQRQVMTWSLRSTDAPRLCAMDTH